MLVGYVSDERYMAVADALVELERDGQSVCVVRSSPRGAIHADVAPGAYHVTLAKDGFGSKSVTVSVDPARPYQFRLLADRLLGYMWPKWCRAGDRAEFRVHSVEPCRLTLWRYGWRKELQRMIGWHDEHGPRAAMQITPDGDYTPTGVQWNRQGYGNPHQSQLVTAPERSGLYYVHAEGEESGAFFSFPWIVAPRRPQARVAVLASNFTWNAYNSFGGRSNYINADRLPERPTVNARLDLPRYTESGAFNVWGPPDAAYAALSFERPEVGNHVPAEMEVTDPIRGRLACGMAPAEWRLLGWLEREGYAYDFYAETQLDDGLLDLDAYRVLVLSVHPEYWTRRMYASVKTWVEQRGGRLMYLGGNGLNCEVERLDASTMRCRTQLLSVGGELGMRDPGDPRIYLESRMHRTLESEANLLGLVTTHTGIMTGAPYRVRDAGHWSFAGTGLRDGDVFGSASLQERVPGGASGHETDKMSASSPGGTLLLAKGLNPDDGGAEIVYRETPSGGAVFSVGSITYVASLLADPAVSRLTTNVLGRLLAGGDDGPRPPVP
jgi:hypothetical protein